jgi:hypothetical protein
MDSDYMFLCGVMWCRVRTARGRQGAFKGWDFDGSGYEGSGLGDAGERCSSPQRLGKTSTDWFSRESWVNWGRHRRWMSTLTTQASFRPRRVTMWKIWRY